MSWEITWEDRRKAKVLAQIRQKRLRGKVRVQINQNTWIYVPKKIARSKRKLRAFLSCRDRKLLEKKALETGKNRQAATGQGLSNEDEKAAKAVLHKC
ncbi:hypothetical protein [Microscilla marina]|uniref:Small hepatitis D antigen, putative n=1 Tax=Microscilla marina ATCC 23134 TaxID=313606 RepID=A1ZIS8_MICM2|nr:hypothetical protein [Microscilla marina]EAY29946.1 small hepatitis D antigen, putative [Microscilla marina ATCC 23134]